jgi:ubiquinone biosynthesis protein
VGLEPIRLTMGRVANRVLLGLLIAALLISSSVVVLAKVPPLVSNIPLLGFIGYVLAGILSLMLAASIWFRSR